MASSSSTGPSDPAERITIEEILIKRCGIDKSTQTHGEGPDLDKQFDLEVEGLGQRVKRLRVLTPKECLDAKKEAHITASVRATSQAYEAEEFGRVSVQTQTGEPDPLIFYHYTRYLRKPTN